jgi:hypothetical protein
MVAESRRSTKQNYDSSPAAGFMTAPNGLSADILRRSTAANSRSTSELVVSK